MKKNLAEFFGFVKVVVIELRGEACRAIVGGRAMLDRLIARGSH